MAGPQSPSKPIRDTCYYDGMCGLCQRSRRILTTLDWLHRLDFRDMTKVPPAELPVPMIEAMQGMPMRTRQGRVLVGYPAVRRALLQTPLGFLPTLLLYVPGISYLGGRAYRVIAANRGRQACTVHHA
ncbi:MAG TPA: DUF393 domain-containing protein [Phycisphaerales bacterium]|nr:DUF393 domain-containing protein [Phycisphaerales bacterium]